jgi:hypothetical protein
MSRLLFLSITSAALLVGCSDDKCGAMGAADVGLVAATDQVTITYGHLSALAGNDCPDPAAPAGVVSQTISGTQTDGTGLVTLCVPRPDLLMTGTRAFGTATSMADVRITDATGTANNCTFTLDSTRTPSGGLTAKGVCGNGDDPAGFQIVASGGMTLKRDCAGALDSVPVTFRGTVAVAHRSQ